MEAADSKYLWKMCSSQKKSLEEAHVLISSWEEIVRDVYSCLCYSSVECERLKQINCDYTVRFDEIVALHRKILSLEPIYNIENYADLDENCRHNFTKKMYQDYEIFHQHMQELGMLMNHSEKGLVSIPMQNIYSSPAVQIHINNGKFK